MPEQEARKPQASPQRQPVLGVLTCEPGRSAPREDHSLQDDREEGGYQVVSFDATGRQVAWAPNGPQRTRTLALQHLSLSALPRDMAGYAVVRMVTVETVVRQTLLEKKVASGPKERTGWIAMNC